VGERRLRSTAVRASEGPPTTAGVMSEAAHGTRVEDATHAASRRTTKESARDVRAADLQEEIVKRQAVRKRAPGY
jgi:hypothetical protein